MGLLDATSPTAPARASLPVQEVQGQYWASGRSKYTRDAFRDCKYLDCRGGGGGIGGGEYAVKEEPGQAGRHEGQGRWGRWGNYPVRRPPPHSHGSLESPDHLLITPEWQMIVMLRPPTYGAVPTPPLWSMCLCSITIDSL